MNDFGNHRQGTYGSGPNILGEQQIHLGASEHVRRLQPAWVRATLGTGCLASPTTEAGLKAYCTESRTAP